MKRKLFLIAALALCLAQVASADVTWTGAGADTNWTTLENWSDAEVPTAGENVTFASGGVLADYGATARTVGLLTFSQPGFLVQGTSNFTFSGIDVTAAGSYTINTTSAARWNMVGGSTINIVQNADLSITGYGTAADFDLIKTGAGTLNLKSSYDRGLGHINVQGGLLYKSAGTDWGARTITVASGATLRSGNAFTIGKYNSGGETSTVEGTFINSSTLEFFGTLKFAGDGVLSGMATYPTVTIPAGSKMVLDNTTTNNTDRLFKADTTTGLKNSDTFHLFTMNGGTLELIGNASATSSETLGAINPYKGKNVLRVQAGEGQDAIFYLTTVGANGTGSTEFGMLVFETSVDQATGKGSFVRWTGTTNRLTNGIFNGFYRVGDEFASYDASRNTIALAADHASRSNQLEGSLATNNVLVNATQTSALTVPTAVHTLKIDGAYGVDLGASTLTLTTGGLIQTGTANAAGITGGTIASGAATALYIQTATDLTISSAISSNRITKIGAGTLSLTGTLAATTVINHSEGGLMVDSSADFRVNMYGTDRQSFTKAGSGTVTLWTWQAENTAAMPNNVMDIRVLGGVAKRDVDSYNGRFFARGGTLEVAAGAKYWDGSSRTMTGVDFSGDGTVMMNSTVDGLGTVRTLTATGGSFAPAGVLTVNGGLTLAKNGSANVAINVDALAAGSDMLAVTGSLAGLANAQMNIAIGGGIAAGSEITVVSSTNDLTGQAFAAEPTFVTPFTTGTLEVSGTTGSGWVKLKNIVYQSALAGSGTVASFGDTIAASTAVTLTDGFGLSNAGHADSLLNIIGTPVITGTDASLFSATLNTGDSSLAFGESALWNLVFLGSATSGSYSASVTFTTDAQVGSQIATLDLLATVTAATIKMGDADGDTFVDDDDLSLLLSNWKGGNVGWSKGDFNASGDVDDDDLSLLLSNWTGSGGGTIPEPATMALLILGGIGLIRRRK